MARKKRRNRRLTPAMLTKQIFKCMERMDNLNFLESYAMFMGKAQLIEFSLKKILSRRFRYSETRLKRMTLGGAISELGNLDMRPDFVSLLRELNKCRIDMAHDFLVGHMASIRLFGQKFSATRMAWRPIEHALWNVEQAIHVYDFLNQNRYLFRRQRTVY